jgi:hypothetical protein
LQAPLLIPLLSAAEEDADLHLVSCCEELLGLACSDIQVVLPGAHGDADVLQFLRFLEEPLLLLLLLLLVAKLVEFDGPGDGRRCVRRNLDEVESLLSRDAERVVAFQYAEVSTLLVDDAELRSGYLVVDAVVDAIILP